MSTTNPPSTTDFLLQTHDKALRGSPSICCLYPDAQPNRPESSDCPSQTRKTPLLEIAPLVRVIFILDHVSPSLSMLSLLLNRVKMGSDHLVHLEHIHLRLFENGMHLVVAKNLSLVFRIL